MKCNNDGQIVYKDGVRHMSLTYQREDRISMNSVNAGRAWRSMKFAGGFVLSALILNLAIFATQVFAEDPKPAAPAAWSVPPLLPSDTLGVITVRDVKKLTAKLQQTGMWQIISNSDVHRAFSAPLLQAQFGMAAVELRMQISFADIASYFSQGEITVAILGIDKKDPQGRPMPDLLIGVQALEKSQAMMDEINKRLDQLKANFGGNLPIAQSQAGIVTINKVTIPVPDNPITFSFAQADGNILVALGEGRLEKLLAMHDAAKAAPGAAPAGTLAEVPSFKKALEKAGPDGDLLAFVNVESLLKNPILNIQPRNDAEKTAWEISGLTTIHAVSYCSGVKGRGIRESFFIDSPAATRKGILGLVEDQGLDASALSAAPRSSLIALAFKMTPETFFNRAVELASIQNPNAKATIDTALVNIGQQLNLDLKKELFSGISGQGVFSISMPSRASKLAVGFPTPLLVVGIKDPAALKNTLASLRKAVQDNILFNEVEDGDHEIVVAREKFPQRPQAGQIAYTIDKQDLLISLYPLALREELLRRAAAVNPNQGGSLSDDPDFMAARSNVGAKPEALGYVDTGTLATAAYEVLIPLAQMAPRVPEIDLNALPVADVISRNLGGTVFDFGADADGVIAEGYSPTGGFSLIGPAVAAASRFARARMGNGNFNALGGARRMGQRTDVMNNVGRALKSYSAENGGKYPAALTDLTPKQLGGLGADKLRAVVYRGQQDADNKVVAHSTDKVPGPITALLQNGNVVQIKHEMLASVIEKGFSADAAAPAPLTPPAPGNDEAVKPPKPPEF